MDLFQAFLIHAMVGRGLAIALITTIVVVVAVTVRNTVNQTRWALKAGGDIRQYRRAPVLTQAALRAARRARRTGLPSDEFYHLSREAEPVQGGMSFEELYAEEHAAYYHVRGLLPQWSSSSLADEREARLENEWRGLDTELTHLRRRLKIERKRLFALKTPIGCLPNEGEGWSFHGEVIPEGEYLITDIRDADEMLEDYTIDDAGLPRMSHPRRRIARKRRAAKSSGYVSVVSEPYRRYEILKERRCGKTTRRILAR
jgi:hypothetical protein